MGKLVIANWKSNPATLDEAVNLAKATDIRGAIISPPDIYLQELKNNLSNADLCAQNMFWEDTGSYTGETSWRQLNNMGIKYVIIGHSERRKYLNETDLMINKKVLAAFQNNITPILCVGEPEEVREKGVESAKEFIKNQLQKAFSNLETINSNLETVIIAYEPIWAIGTGKPATPEAASEISRFIKESLKTKNYNLETKVLYGGSVDSSNASSFSNEQDIDGALVGGASLKPDEFKKIYDIFNKS